MKVLLTKILYQIRNDYDINKIGENLVSKKEFKRCWEYFNCSKSSMDICPAYKVGNKNKNFKDCYFYVNNNLIGGPEKNGPCAYCKWNKLYGLNIV